MKTKTFIFVHNQDIILDFIKIGKFNKIDDLKYVFLGYGPINNIIDNPLVIIARNLEHNIENYPKLTSYTGWYALWKNKLYDGDYLNLFEYDVNLTESFYNFNLSDKTKSIYGYIEYMVHMSAIFFVSKWSDKLIYTIKKNYNIDLIEFISKIPQGTKCSATSNHTMKKNIFEEYMTWVNPLVDDIKESPMSGHQIERSIIAFYLLKNIDYKIESNMLTHYNLDSHNTQYSTKERFENGYKNLLK